MGLALFFYPFFIRLRYCALSREGILRYSECTIDTHVPTFDSTVMSCALVPLCYDYVDEWKHDTHIFYTNAYLLSQGLCNHCYSEGSHHVNDCAE
jgi:hypothetical protein